MRVLEVCPDFPPWAGSGAAETFRLLARSWGEMGHEVTVVCSRPSSRAGDPPAGAPYRVECFRLFDLPPSLYEASYFAPMRGGDRRRFHDFIRREAPSYDRIIVQGLLETVPRSFLLRCRSVPPDRLISLQYGISTAEYSRVLGVASRWLHKTLGRWLVSRLRTVVVFSSGSVPELREYFGALTGTNVVQRTLGIDTVAFGKEWASVAPPSFAMAPWLEGRSIRPPFIFAIGRNNRAKGFDLLVKSFIPLAKEFPSLSLVLAGERTPLTQELESSVHAAGLDSRVRILGRIPSQDHMALLAACTVFAIPSRKEGFGLNAVHAKILGRPTVATSTGAHVEILGNERPFWIVPPGDVPRLTDALREALHTTPTPLSADPRQLARFDIRVLAEELLRPPPLGPRPDR